MQVYKLSLILVPGHPAAVAQHGLQAGFNVLGVVLVLPEESQFPVYVNNVGGSCLSG